MLDQRTHTEPLRNLEQRHCLAIRQVSSKDEAILVAARTCLNSCGFAELCGIQCECEQGKLTLRGRLSSFYLKQLAQESLRQLRDAELIINSTEVLS